MKYFYLLIVFCIAFPARADDVVFAADEVDIKAFDGMLAKQQAKSGSSRKDAEYRNERNEREGKNDNFGAIVREEAHKLRDADSRGKGEMGAFVSEQRRQDSLNRGKSLNSGPGNASSERGQDSELRSFVSENKGSDRSRSNQGSNRGRGRGN